MRGIQCQRPRQIVLPLVKGLLRHAEDQIERQIRDARANEFDDARHIVRLMIALKDVEQARLKRLHAEAEPIDAKRAEQIDLIDIEVARVRFDGEFMIRVQRQPMESNSDQPHCLLRRE